MAITAKEYPMYPIINNTSKTSDVEENYLTGFISLFRSIRDHWIWEDPKKFQWWVDILMECNHSDKKVPIGFELIDCKRGQTLHSLLEWSKRWRVDISTVRRFFILLKSDNMIITEDLRKTTRLTVCNYDSYQSKRQTVKPDDAPPKKDETLKYEEKPTSDEIKPVQLTVIPKKEHGELSESEQVTELNDMQSKGHANATQTPRNTNNNDNNSNNGLDSNTIIDVSLVPNGTPEPQRELAEIEWKRVHPIISNSEEGLKDFILTHKPKFIHPYAKYWNIVAGEYGWPQIESLNDERKKKLKTRLKESAFDFTRIIEKAKDSEFFGRDGKIWVSFDWIINSQKNYTKLIEGNYLKAQAKQQQKQNPSTKQMVD